MISDVVVLGGLGQVGRLLSAAFQSAGARITTVDVAPPPPSSTAASYLQGDVGNPGGELKKAIGRANCVCVCLPERVAIAAARGIVDTMKDGALWVDTLSVKSDIVNLVAHCTGSRLEAISINPMFAPALGWKGNAVALIQVSRTGPLSEAFCRLLADTGAVVEIVSAQEHDKLTAAVQVATHAAVLTFGATLLKQGYNLQSGLKLSTPPHRFLLALLYRMASQNAEVYWDIQAYHPHGASVRESMIQALDEVQAAAGQGRPESFEQLFDQLKALILPEGAVLSQWAKGMIASVSGPPEPMQPEHSR